MQTNVNVLVKEDNSVQEKIKRTAQSLDKKYSKKRKVNEKMLMKKRGPVARVFSIIVDVLLVAMCVICCAFGLSSFIFKINNLPPSFAGYSFMQISSGSMVASGYDKYDAIVIRTVNPKTLNVGDEIAFYYYSKDSQEFDYLTKTEITHTKDETDHAHSLTFGGFFGVPTSEHSTAAKAMGTKRVFHEIIKIYEDENGMYWFKTKGTSNETEDPWEVSERMVIGVIDKSPFANFMSSLLQLLSSNLGVLIIIAVPLILLSISFVFKMIKRVQLAKLELDCVEEKRKITDEICVRNNVGFNMTTGDKYKVLAQAPDDKREEYLSLLWKDGSAPNSIRKYVIRKKFKLKEHEQMLEVHRACEKMYADGKDGEEIAKYYIAEKEKIENEQSRYKKIFKNMRKKFQENKELPEQATIDCAYCGAKVKVSDEKCPGCGTKSVKAK